MAGVNKKLSTKDSNNNNYNDKLKSYGAISINMTPSPNSTDLPTWRSNNNSNTQTDNQERLLDNDDADSNNNDGNNAEIQLQPYQYDGDTRSLLPKKSLNGSGGKYTAWYYNLTEEKRHKLFVLAIAMASSLLVLFFVTLHNRGRMPAQPAWKGVHQGPLSTLHPVHDLGIPDFTRPMNSMPNDVLSGGAQFQRSGPFPTNAWYQSLLLTQNDGPSVLHRAYSVPYIVDAVGPIPGLQTHYGHVSGSSLIIQFNVEDHFGLTMGAAGDLRATHPKVDSSRIYSVGAMTPLGVELKWDTLGMSAPVVKGMPYSTMKYNSWSEKDKHDQYILPTVASAINIRNKAVVVDSHNHVTCDNSTSDAFLVQRDVEMAFENSDFTWLAFFSEPVYLQCRGDDTDGFKLQVITSAADHHDEIRPLYVRTAMYKVCSSGRNPIYCHPEDMHPNALLVGQGEYGEILRNHSYAVPGINPTVKHAYDDTTAELTYAFDWDVVDSRVPGASQDDSETDHDLIMFALPHHFDIFRDYKTPTGRLYCASGLLGFACLVQGGKWELVEETPVVGLRAPRPPAAWSFEMLEKALEADLLYRLPEYFVIGAGDTYFSGKMLSKHARILTVAEELYEICDSVAGADSLDESGLVREYDVACSKITLPDKKVYHDSIAALKGAVEIWINGSAVAPFVYDNTWGGLVNCGCDFNGTTCNNKFPDCPAFNDPGLNFGNAFYNDMHFHYGYHIYAAAAVAHFDPAWGRENFERIMLYIRNIANPDETDRFFTTWRHKDWYQGHSWASGITQPPVLNGRNQESSSEAISAYEGIAVFGAEMVKAWSEVNSPKVAVAKQLQEIGLILTASEVRSANKYWHIRKNEAIKILPTQYSPHVVGIMWQTMAQFQTWFGGAPYLAIGIQFIPLTPVSESRDEIEWSKEVYHSFSQSCGNDFSCTNNGWSMLEIALQATVGHPRLASGRAYELPESAFTSPGGNGQSMSNLIWYVASRAMVGEPLPLSREEYRPAKNTTSKLIDCGNPNYCTEYSLDTITNDYSCRQRIRYLMSEPGKSEMEACFQVAVYDYPNECGACDPRLANDDETDDDQNKSSDVCPACSDEQCRLHFNLCPVYDNTFVCTQGSSVGGCSPLPWAMNPAVCDSCCELTDCPKLSEAALKLLGPPKVDVDDSNCPPCDDDTCPSATHACPLGGLAPYFCAKGKNVNGCSQMPWPAGEQCERCCKVSEQCEE